MTGTSPKDYALGPLLRRAHRRAAGAFDSALEPLGLEGRHFGILLTLHRLGPVSQQELTRQLGSDKSSMVRLIDSLESRGLVVRRPARGDRRAFAVTLTPEGERAFAAAERTAAEVGRGLAAHLAESERAELQRLLARFVGADPQDDQPLPSAASSPAQ